MAVAAPRGVACQGSGVTLGGGFTDKSLIVSQGGEGEARRKGEASVAVVALGGWGNPRHAIHARWGVDPHHRWAGGIGDPGIERLLDVGARPTRQIQPSPKMSRRERIEKDAKRPSRSSVERGG